MNKVCLTGRNVRPIELRYSEGSQIAVARLTIAVERKFKKEGDQQADFIQCKAFGKTAENLAKYIEKGRRIGIAGRLSSGSYVNREGQTVYYTEVIIEEFDFLDSAPKKDTEDTKNITEECPGFGDQLEMEEDLPWN